MVKLVDKPETTTTSDAEPSKRARARRTFLKGLGAVGLTGMIAGCGSNDGGSGGGDGGGGSDGGDGGSGDGGGSGGGGDERVKVHPFEVVGNPPTAGVKYQVEARTAEVWQENLPFEITHTPMDAERVVDKYFFEQDADVAFNAYSIRPERMDPHMLLFGNFHSSRTPCGSYNQTHYRDDYMDGLLEEQARTTDRDARREIIHEIQAELTSLDGNSEFGSEHVITHPGEPHVWNARKFENVTVVPGMGLQTIWSYNEITPKTDDRQLVIPMGAGAPNITPLSSNQTNRETIKQVYDTLTKLGKDGQDSVPWLATDWEISDDNLEYTMTVREDHTFHDGEPVTAEDVAFSYEYHGEHSPMFSGSIDPFESIEALDDTTVRFTLTEPFSPIFIFTFNRVPILPKHIWEDIPDSVDVDEAWRWSPTAEDKLIGSGHFQLTHWRKDDEIRLDAFEDHFKRPQVDTVVLVPTADPQAFIGGFEQETLDMAFDVDRVDPTNLVNAVESADHLEYETVISVGSFPFAMNTDAAPTNFPEVRAALASTVPKKEAVEEIHGGFAEMGNSMISPVLPFWYNADQTMWGMSFGGREEAIRILEERGFVIEDGTAYYPPGEAPESKRLPGYGCQ
jgi:peptide/nickel transport system substrate-binding protein